MEAKSPGYQLLAALSDLFRATMPAASPRQGKRLDSQWGEFGILAALYFAPFQFATVRPDTLLDAWGRIDEVVALFVFGQDQEDVSPEEIERYRLIADEDQAAPTSTISDWHVRGLERLAEALLARERLLSAEMDRPSVVLDPEGASESEPNGTIKPKTVSSIKSGLNISATNAGFGRVWPWSLCSFSVGRLGGSPPWRGPSGLMPPNLKPLLVLIFPSIPPNPLARSWIKLAGTFKPCSGKLARLSGPGVSLVGCRSMAAISPLLAICLISPRGWSSPGIRLTMLPAPCWKLPRGISAHHCR